MADMIVTIHTIFFVPDDHNRVILENPENTAASDYINASLISVIKLIISIL